MLDRFVPGFVIGTERESSLTHIHPGGGSQLSHPFWRDTNGAVDGACGGKHFSVMLQRNIAVHRNRRFQSERATPPTGWPVAFTTSSLLNIRALAPKVLFSFLLSSRASPLATTRIMSFLTFSESVFAICQVRRYGLSLPDRRWLCSDLIR